MDKRQTFPEVTPRMSDSLLKVRDWHDDAPQQMAAASMAQTRREKRVEENELHSKELTFQLTRQQVHFCFFTAYKTFSMETIEVL
jgi:hypothetical protein